MTIPYRPLGLIKEMIEAVGLEVTYVFEELVFIEHNAFLLQMGEEGKNVAVRFNTESKPEARPEMLSRLQRASSPLGLDVAAGGLFSIHQEDGEETFQLKFIPSASQASA